MTDFGDYGDEDIEESGSSLRRKLEETLTRERQLTTELSGLKAKELITERGYGLVKVEDLVDVNLDEMSTKAEELQQERAGQQADLARDMLAKRGLQGEELEQAVADFLSPGSAPGDAAARTRAKEMSAVGGSAAPLQDASGLVGLDAIEHAVRTGR